MRTGRSGNARGGDKRARVGAHDKERATKGSKTETFFFPHCCPLLPTGRLCRRWAHSSRSLFLFPAPLPLCQSLSAALLLLAAHQEPNWSWALFCWPVEEGPHDTRWPRAGGTKVTVINCCCCCCPMATNQRLAAGCVCASVCLAVWLPTSSRAARVGRQRCSKRAASIKRPSIERPSIKRRPARRSPTRHTAASLGSFNKLSLPLWQS